MEIGNKNAVILCNGEPPYKSQLTACLKKADMFIAADGGGNTALKFNLTPDLVIGDLDSFNLDLDPPCPIIKNLDQNSNDLEKALIYTLNMQIDTVIVFGATGRRADQTVKNLSVLKQFDNQFKNILFRDKYCDIKLISSPHIEELPLNTSVSLFPLSGRVTNINSSGLKYKLCNDTLENGVFDGSSNETTDSLIRITYNAGDLLLFINHKTE